MKILIADDEPLARERLSSLCNELANYEVVGEASHGKQILDLIPELEPDIILLDIRMPGMDGLEAAQHISKLDTPPAIIFTTAYDQYALSAFDSHAVGYLLKPIKKDLLLDSLNAASRVSRAQLQSVQSQRAQIQASQSPRYISARIKNNIQLIPIESIRYFQADQKYVSVGFIENDVQHEVLIEESLKSLEQTLQNAFIRIHRNALIAESFISGLDKDTEGAHWLCLQGMENKIEVSRRHLPEIRKIIKDKTL